MDFPTQVLRDQNENKPVTSIKIVYTCDFCDFRTENPELMGYVYNVWFRIKILCVVYYCYEFIYKLN